VNAILMAVALFVVAAVPAHAIPITFTSRAAFNAAAPGLPLETFEAGLVSAGLVTVCNGPLSGATDSLCFPVGGLLSGVTYSASPGPSMAVLGANFLTVGNASIVLGPNAFSDTFNIAFSGSANAVGFDVFAGPGAGNVAISAFTPADVPLGAFTILAPVGGTFFGLISDSDAIGRLNIASLTSSPGELVDNLAFGTAATVPEPVSMLLLGSGLVGICARRKRLFKR
jgi:PEP-CTERM motif-containing protein